MNDLIKKVYRCEKEGAASGLVNALLWASVIIAGSWLSRGSENADAFFIILISAATISMLFVDRQRKNNNARE